jgi:hypothetical protein
MPGVENLGGDSQVRLLENVLRVSGGLDLWRLTRRFTVHMSVTASLCAARCSTAQLRELVAEGSTQTQALEIIGFARAGPASTLSARLGSVGRAGRKASYRASRLA